MDELPVSKPKSVPDQLKGDTNPDASMDLTGSDLEEDQVVGAGAVSKTKHGKSRGPFPPLRSAPVS